MKTRRYPTNPRRPPGPSGPRSPRAGKAAPPVPTPPAPKSVPPPPVPAVPQPPRPGRWVWTCRAGFERHLHEELTWAKRSPKVLGVALLESDPPKGHLPAFGRAGFRATGVHHPSEADLAGKIAAEWVDSGAAARGVHVQAWTLDTPEANPASQRVAALGAEVAQALPPVPVIGHAWAAKEQGASLGQLCWASDSLLITGHLPAGEAEVLAPGGRQRMRREADSPSRAAAKVDEALDWLGLAPGRGEVCVDLGAAPGGWTRRLLARGARVIAVDPAKLAPDLMQQRKLSHVQESAFDYTPEEPVDWLFCDMAWRPLEVAQLLARWGRQGWSFHLVANIKLPMKDKNPMLWRVRHTLEAGGWKNLKIRQLYHDRDEVTLTARRA